MIGASTLTRLLVAGLLAVVPSLATLANPEPAWVATAKASTARSWSVNGRVLATRIVGDTVFVGGNFTTAINPTGESVKRHNFAAFRMSTGALRTNWVADAGAPVRAIETDGTYLYVGGSFGQVDGHTHARLAKIRVSTGAVDPAFRPNFNGSVRAIGVDATSVYVGGAFTRVNGVTRLRLAKLSRGGVLDRRFRPSADKEVYGLAKARSSSTVYVSGQFARLNHTARNGVGAVKASTGATTGRVFRKAARPTLGLAINPSGSRLYGAGGTWTNSAVAWNTSTGARIWHVIARGDIQAIRYYHGTVYFGFHDGYQKDRRLKLLAVNAATGAVHRKFRPHFDGFWGVRAIDVSSRGVVVGGDFTEVNGVVARGWARLRR